MTPMYKFLTHVLTAYVAVIIVAVGGLLWTHFESEFFQGQLIAAISLFLTTLTLYLLD